MRRAAALLIVTPLLLTGCAATDPADGGDRASPGEAPKVLGSKHGLPQGLRPADRMGRPVAAILGRGRLGLTTWGSSSCPSLPVRAEVTGSDTLRVTVRIDARPGEPCTADLGPTTTRIGVDPALTEDGQVQVVVALDQQRREVRLTARRVERG
jgi:hypothetical protein